MKSNKSKSMSILNKLIDYIDNNYIYGSYISMYKLDDLLDKYNINIDDQNVVFKELQSLKIKIIDQFYKKELIELFKSLKDNNDIPYYFLKNWFNYHNISQQSQYEIIDLLQKNGYKIIHKSNKDSIENYILNNFTYGSSISIKTLEKLIIYFNIQPVDKFEIFDFINSLSLEVIDEYHKSEIRYLISKADSKKQIDKVVIENLNQNSISLKDKNEICDYLEIKGYKILDTAKENDKLYFDTNNEEFEDLTKLFHKETFKKELESVEDPIDKKYNAEYLESLHSSPKERKKVMTDIVKANKELVYWEVKKYIHLATSSFDDQDMYQVGMMGLMKGAEKFDTSTNNEFSTYAFYWIKQAITIAIANYSQVIRKPVHKIETINKLKKIRNSLIEDLIRDPKPEEIAAEADMKTNEVRDCLKYMQPVISLDKPIGDKNDSVLGDFIADNNMNNPEKAAEMEDLIENENRILSTLSDREEKVIRLRYGLDNDQPKTLEEIGKILGVTRERIRQIQVKALKKLKRKCSSNSLKDFIM